MQNTPIQIFSKVTPNLPIIFAGLVVLGQPLFWHNSVILTGDPIAVTSALRNKSSGINPKIFLMSVYRVAQYQPSSSGSGSVGASKNRWVAGPKITWKVSEPFTTARAYASPKYLWHMRTIKAQISLIYHVINLSGIESGTTLLQVSTLLLVMLINWNIIANLKPNLDYRNMLNSFQTVIYVQNWQLYYALVHMSCKLRRGGKSVFRVRTGFAVSARGKW